MTIPVNLKFLPASGKPDLVIDVPYDTPEQYRVRAAVEIAVARKISLAWVDLSDANLTGASLTRTNLIAAAPETAAERDYLLALNAELLAALVKVAQWQREECEMADAEMLFMLLDNKIDIARAAIAKATA